MCLYAWKSIKIGKSLISSAPREFEWNPKRFVPRLLPQNLKLNISKYWHGCRPQVTFTTISNWFLFIFRKNKNKISIEISFDPRLLLRLSARLSYTSRQSWASPSLQLLYFLEFYQIHFSNPKYHQATLTY